MKQRPHRLHVRIRDMRLVWDAACPYGRVGSRPCARTDTTVGCLLVDMLRQDGMGAGVFLDDGPLAAEMPVTLEWIPDDEVLLLHRASIKQLQLVPPAPAPDRKPEPVRALLVANPNENVECSWCEADIRYRAAVVLAFKGQLVIDRWHPDCYTKAGDPFGEPNADLHRRPGAEPRRFPKQAAR